LALEQPPLTTRVFPQLKLIASHPGGWGSEERQALVERGIDRIDRTTDSKLSALTTRVERALQARGVSRRSRSER
jgi:hypothetical protein